MRGEHRLDLVARLDPLDDAEREISPALRDLRSLARIDDLAKERVEEVDVDVVCLPHPFDDEAARCEPGA